MQRMGRLALPAAAAALAFALAGCGGGGGEKKGTDPEGPTLSTVALAATKTADAGSARFSFSMTTKGVQGTTQAFSLTGEGAFDYESQRGSLTLDIGALADTLGPGAGSEIEIIFDGAIIYLRFPFLTEQLGQGKPWLKLDLVALGTERGLDLGQLAQLNRGNPTQALNYLRAAGDFTKAGEEDVRGAATTRYRGTIDLRKALELVEGEQRAPVQEVIDEAGLTELPAEAWVDGDGFLRKMKLEYAKLPGLKGSLTLAMELYDHGGEVDVAPPPAAQVTDITELSATGE